MSGMNKFDPKERRRRRRELVERDKQKGRVKRPHHSYGDDDDWYYDYLKGLYDEDS